MRPWESPPQAAPQACFSLSFSSSARSVLVKMELMEEKAFSKMVNIIYM